jgi:hypothetical protein
MTIFYSIPGRFAFSKASLHSSIIEKIDENKKDYYFEFTNILSPESCEINIEVKNKTVINDLRIDCLLNCFLMLTSEKISFNNINIVIFFLIY